MGTIRGITIRNASGGYGKVINMCVCVCAWGAVFTFSGIVVMVYNMNFEVEITCYSRGLLYVVIVWFLMGTSRLCASSSADEVR